MKIFAINIIILNSSLESVPMLQGQRLWPLGALHQNSSQALLVCLSPKVMLVLELLWARLFLTFYLLLPHVLSQQKRH